MAYILLTLMTIRCFVKYLSYCKASLKEFNATSAPSFLPKTLNAGESSLYAKVKVEFLVGQSEVVCGILKLYFRAPDRLILVFVGALLAEQTPVRRLC